MKNRKGNDGETREEEREANTFLLLYGWTSEISTGRGPGG